MPVYKQANLPKGIRLSDEEYHRGLLKFVKYCHDVVVLDSDGLLYLGERRSNKTPSGPWFIGGQVSIFRDINESLAELFRRETGLVIDPGRFNHEWFNRYMFDGSDGGVPHDAVCEIFTLLLTREELSRVSLDPTEYVQSKLAPYDAVDIAAIANPLTRKIFADLWELINT